MKLMKEHQTSIKRLTIVHSMGQITTLCGHLEEEGRTNNKIRVEAVLIDSVMYKRPPVILGPAFGDWLLLQRQIS